MYYIRFTYAFLFPGIDYKIHIAFVTMSITLHTYIRNVMSHNVNNVTYLHTLL